MTDNDQHTIPSTQQVIHVLARKMYLAFCEKKGWDPHPFPYVDNSSIQYATIAVGYLGFEDDVDLSVE